MYERHILGTLPRWLGGPWGRRWFGTFGRFIDTAIEASRQAVLARYVRHCPADALPYHAADLSIPRFRTDSPGTLRARLQDPWAWWAEIGLETGTRSVLSILGFGSGELDTCFWDAKTGFSNDGSDWWSRWWVLARDGHAFELHTDYDTQAASGLTWDDAAEIWTWDCTAAGDVVEQARAFLWEYKWPHGVPIALYIKFGTGSLWDEWLFLEPNNTWDWANGSGLTWDEAGDATRVVWELGQLWDYDVSEVGAVPTWGSAEAMGLRWGGRYRPPASN